MRQRVLEREHPSPRPPEHVHAAEHESLTHGFDLVDEPL